MVRFAIFAGTLSPFRAVGRRLHRVAGGWRLQASGRVKPAQGDVEGHSRATNGWLPRGRPHVAAPTRLKGSYVMY
jgi:hypothetical protein